MNRGTEPAVAVAQGAPLSTTAPDATPNFLIVGAMKCGTTSLAAYLARHPQVFIPPEKELHFFTDNWERGLEWFRGRFADAGDAIAVGEATPEYLWDPRALDRMVATVPHAKLIVILRDPVQRAYSHYQHWRRQGRDDRPFAQCVEAELRHAAAPGPGRPEPYLDKGLYCEQLRRLVASYPPERTLVVLLDDLEARPQDVFREVCGFLEIDPDFIPPNLGERLEPGTIHYHPAWLWRLIVAVRLGNWVPKRTGAWIHNSMVRTHEPYPSIDPEIDARLRQFFAPHNAELAAWLERDLSAWNARR